MATVNCLLSGTAKWAKLVDAEPEYDKTKSSWTIDLYLDDSQWSIFKNSGLLLSTRTDKDGEKFVRFKRPTTKTIKGEVVHLDPPKVLDADDKPLKKHVGNGSKVIVKLSVYDVPKGKGHTLDAVKVTNLVEYVPKPTISSPDIAPF